MAYKIVGEGGGSGGNGADKEREELQELARAIVDAAKQGAWTAAQAVEQPRQENAPPRLPWPVFRSLKQDSFTRGGGSRGGGASRGNDPWGQAEQSPFIRGGISGGGGARRGGSPWEQVAYPPDGAGSGGPEQELTEEASPEREEEAEQEEKSVSLPPVRQLLAKIAGAAGAGIAGAAGAVNAGIQAVGAAGRIAETFLRPKGVSDWDWSWRESAAQDAKNDLEKSAALYNVGQAKLDAAQRISEELNRKVVFDGTLPVDKTGIIDPETGTIRLNARVGGPENLRDNAVQLLEEQPKTGLDSSGSPGYNAGEEGLFQDAGKSGRSGISVREQLLGKVENPKLKNAIHEMYRPGASTGDGGLADAVRYELSTGELVGGKSHIQKAMERVKNLENIIKKQKLSNGDLKIANKLITDLKNALGGK